MSHNTLAPPTSSTALVGLKALSSYMNKNEKTIRRLLKNGSFPAVKIGGEWTSDTLVIDTWLRKQVESSIPANTFNFACSN